MASNKSEFAFKQEHLMHRPADVRTYFLNDRLLVHPPDILMRAEQKLGINLAGYDRVVLVVDANLNGKFP